MKDRHYDASLVVSYREEKITRAQVRWPLPHTPHSTNSDITAPSTLTSLIYVTIYADVTTHSASLLISNVITHSGGTTQL